MTTSLRRAASASGRDRTFRRPPTWRALAVVAVALAVALPLAGCGYDHHDGYYDYDTTGYVYLLNSTDLTTFEDVMTFYIAPVGVPFGGNELVAPLPPGAEDYIGEFLEDYYDAESDLEFGDIVEWPDVWVGDYDDTVFEAL